MWQLPSRIHLSLVLKAICTIRFSPGKDLYMEQRGTAGTFISNVQKAQKQHPTLHSLPPPREDGGLQGKENTETTSWSLGHGQRKLVEIFQLGNRSSQAIKCFTQTCSLTTLGAPCSISHTARLAPYKIKASDHKHKKELCSATVHFEHSNRPAPQGETGFVPISFRKRFQPAEIPHYSHGRSGHYTAKGARGTCHRGRSSGELFVHQLQSLAQDVWLTLLSSCGYCVSYFWRVWVLGNPIHVCSGLCNCTLIRCFSQVFFLASHQE